MIDATRYIIFRCPETWEELEEEALPRRNATYALGSYNKALAARIMRYNGMQPAEDGDFTLVWGSAPEVDNISPASFLQKCNHFPYSKRILGNKAELAYIIQNNPKTRLLPKFFPKTFVLPGDRELLYKHMRINPTEQFIAKPPNGSCGHGIKIVHFDNFYGIPGNSVVSQYLSRPLCIDGFKFDMRVYVLVTSFAPLHAFVCKEGLARFATESYSNLSNNVYSHLTNATLNKHGRNWCSEFKWKLSDLLQEIDHRWHHKPSEIMQGICDVVSRSLALVQPVMSPKEKRSVIDPFFELYGFDILLDKDFKMWLLEINTFPSMKCSEAVDFEVKGPVIAQALSICGVPDLDLNELCEIQERFDMSRVDIAEFERQKIRGEDERNRESGNGFIRIFPSKGTAHLADMLAVPKFILAKKEKRERPQTDPVKLAKKFTAEQALDLLVAYLCHLQQKMDDAALAKQVTPRVARFLGAQGYQVSQKGVNIRELLKNFIDRQKTRCQITLRNAQVPSAVKAQIVNSGEHFVSQVLLNTGVSVRNLRTLFY